MNAGELALAFLQNAAEVARYGGLQTTEQPAPYRLVGRVPHCSLRHYFADAPVDGAPILLVTSVLMSADIWDVAERSSAVRQLHAAGFDPWVVDFGHTESSERSLSDSALSVSRAIDIIRSERGRHVHLAGYSQGGLLCYQVAALRRSSGLSSVISFGGPVDMSKMVPSAIPDDALARVGEAIGFVSQHVNVPAWFVKNAFRVADPVKTARNQLLFLLALHNRDALLPREGQRRFLEGHGWMTVPGPFLREFAEQFVMHSRMLQGGMVIDGQTTTLADIHCPVLAVIGDIDQIAPARTIRPLLEAAPEADLWEAHVGTGHLGLVVGSKATESVWPTIIDWAQWIDGDRSRPSGVRRMRDAEESDAKSAPDLGNAVSAQLMRDVPAGVARTTISAARSVIGLCRDTLGQLPHLLRLEQVSADTLTSLGRSLDEQASRDPNQIQFLYRGRAFSREMCKSRLDSVTRGLLEVGVHRGDRVGVLMSGRPSALAAVAALNRIGAIAVLLRPDGDVAHEAELGGVDRVVCDPERVPMTRSLDVPVLVLGGGSERPEFPFAVVDLELIDPDLVDLPRWYTPNPGRAVDIAVILFNGRGEDTRVNVVTNRRWQLSAYGTAAAASLGTRDTVYCLAPPHHPSGLLVAMGGAIAAGARFAIADGFSADQFRDDVRRYGVTVVVYTWTMLREIADDAVNEVMPSHGIRLFVGSGIPQMLWRRVTRRFSPARVVEFYTAPDTEVVLVNLGEHKIGSMGRPLPGSARVAVTAWDLDRSRPALDDFGVARRCKPNEVGMLLAQIDPGDPSTGQVSALRAVFEPDDAWVATGDLVKRDADGDFWFVGAESALIPTATGLRSPVAIRDALEGVDGVDLAVAYAGELDGRPVAVASVVLDISDKFNARDSLAKRIASLPSDDRPDVVHIVDDIPMTPWFRPLTENLPSASDGVASLRIVLDPAVRVE